MYAAGSGRDAQRVPSTKGMAMMPMGTCASLELSASHAMCSTITLSELTAPNCLAPTTLYEHLRMPLTSARRPPMISHVDASRPTPARTSGLFAFCAGQHTNSPIQEFRVYLPIKKIAEHFGRHPDTIRNWIASGKFPKPILLPSGRPAWDDSVLRHDISSEMADTPR